MNAFLIAGSQGYFFEQATIYTALMKPRVIDDVSAVDGYGNTILMYVASFSHDMELIEYLISMDADCRKMNAKDSSMLHFEEKS